MSLTLAFLMYFLGISASYADEIAFSLQVNANNDQVKVTATNVGADAARDVWVEVELAGNSYRSQSASKLPAKMSFAKDFTVRYPSKPGSYALVTRLYYRNDGKQLSVLNVGYFNYQRAEKAPVKLSIDSSRIRSQGLVHVRRSAKVPVTLFVPSEISILGKEERNDRISYRVANTQPDFNSNYQIYAVAQVETSQGIVASSISSAQLSTVRAKKQESVLPKEFFFLAFLLSFIFVAFLYSKWVRVDAQELGGKRIALLRWLFSVAIVSLLYTIFHSFYVIPDFVLSRVSAIDFPQSDVGEYLWRVFRTLLQWLYFDGGDYDYFAKYVADPLYFYMLLGNYFVLRFVIKPDPKTDKYWHLMNRVMRDIGIKSDHPLAQENSKSKIAVLTLMVKMFYVPLLCSWTINDIHHQIFLTERFSWDFFHIHEYLVALLIWIDVSVFAFGYLVELPQLRNQIRSVEPTILGWVVCLMCYPPFNGFAFRPFDHRLTADWTAASLFWQNVAKVVILLLWAIYVWATIALGPKASNLTNRGVVDSGPYAFIRHPAYVSKVSLWIISALFLADKHFFLVVALISVYALRAWTEERHLSMDPEYVEYKKKVPWRFIPKLV